MKVGLEFEIPMIKPNGDPATREDDLKLFETWNKEGWKYKKDGWIKEIVGVYKDFSNGVCMLNTDYGTCTFEVAPPPCDSLTRAIKEWEELLHQTILPVMKRHGLLLLGLGHQPKIQDLSAYRAPKGHYTIFERSMTTERGRWLMENWPGTCAAQYNIDVPIDEVVEAANTFLKLAYLFVAWSANSPVVDAKRYDWLSCRSFGYYYLEQQPFFKYRLCSPQTDFISLKDYVDKAWQFPIFEVVRDGKPLYSPGFKLTMWDFINKKEAKFQDLDGNEYIVSPQLEDFNTALYCAWRDLKIKILFDKQLGVDQIVEAVRFGNVKDVIENNGKNCFIEIRPIDMSRQGDLMSWPALFIGCLKNIKPLHELVRGWSFDQLRDIKRDILKNGLQARHLDKKMWEWGEDVLGLAKEGLKNYDSSLLTLLDPLKKYLESGRSPAHDIIDIFEKDGLEGLMRYTQIK